MIRIVYPATLRLLIALAPLAAFAAEPSSSVPGPAAPGIDRPPSTTESAPAQPYDQGTTATSPGSATTTDGTPGMSGTMPPGSSPRDSAGAMGRPGAEPSVSPMFQQLDTNKDGQISREEAKRSADTTANFDAIDTDHDGLISPAEWKAAEDRKMGR
jgi:hypothetical protein